MTRAILAIVAAGVTGSVVIAQAATQGTAFPSTVRQALSNLVLYAFGTHSVPAGSVRVPIATADATYEAIVTKPGPPKLDPLDARIESRRAK